MGLSRLSIEGSTSNANHCFLFIEGMGSLGRLGYGNIDWIGNGGGQMGDNLDTVDLGSGFTATGIASGCSSDHNCVFDGNVADLAALKCYGNNGMQSVLFSRKQLKSTMALQQPWQCINHGSLYFQKSTNAMP